ncbi:MAG: hypothetical protein AB7G13_28065 [Lautropia sp.]
MDEVFRNFWYESGCASASLQVAAIGLAIVTATVGLIWLISRWAIVRASTRGGTGTLRGGKLVPRLMLATLLVLAAIVLHTALTGTALHRAAFGRDAIALDYCDGMAARTERVAIDDVARIEYRLVYRPAGRGRPTPRDLAVIRLRNGSELEIPLDIDPAVSNPAALTRHLPGAVIDAWDAGRRTRGAAPLPDPYRPRRADRSAG